MPDDGPIILVAGTPHAIRTAQDVLGPSYRYRAALSVEEAIGKLSSGVDLIVCNVSFDGSRMFDFMQAARSSAKTRAIPIVCFRNHDRPLSRSMHNVIDLSVRAFDRATFVDLYSLTRQDGLESALAAFRGAVANSLKERRLLA